MLRSKYLSVVFGIDGLLSIGFGIVSWLRPLSTYGTIIDLSDVGTKPAVTMALLSGLSVFYVLIGLACLCAIFMPPPHNARLALVMIARHAWVGIQGYRNVGQEWIVGNPWPDVVIHGAFVLAYSLLVYMAVRGPSGWRGSPGEA